MKRVTVTLFLLAVASHAQTITSVTNESGSKSICPGGIAFVNGSGLGGTGTTVMVGGKPAFVFNGGNSNLQFEVPVDVAFGPTTVTAGNSAPFNITVAQYAPGVPTDGQADNLAIAFHNPPLVPVTFAFPVAPGEQIVLAATGLGPTNPAIATGSSPSDNNAVVVTLPTVNVGGKPASVSTAFLQPGNPGFYAIAITVPTSLATGNQNVTVNIGGVTSNLAVLPVATGPIVGSVTNAASYNDSTLPNGPVAQGSIFVIKGNNLGPSAISIAPAAFQSTTLSGTSVSVTVNGTTVAVPLYYTSAGQVAALLPSNTPVGTGAITVTYNTQAGPPHPITVTASNPGVFTISSDGQGAGIVTNADYSLVSNTKAANCGGPNTTCGAANPGDTLIIWATGLGPISGGTDASGAGLGVNQTSVPLKIWLGGVQIQATYQGRSGCCVGEDQIVFTVPANVPTGCAVPLSLQVNNFVSNTVTLPVAPVSTRTCTPSNSLFTSASVLQVGSLGSATASYGAVNLIRQDNYPGFQDVLKASFFKFTVAPVLQPFFISYVDDPPMGTCKVFNNLNGGNPPLASQIGLDAGSAITVQGPNGSKTVSGSQGSFNGTLSGSGNFLSAGGYTVSMPGGADIPAFSAPITVPTLPTMTSPPPDSVNSFSVTRANGMTVAWSGGVANEYIEMDIGAATDNTNTIGSGFRCLVSASAGTFTIPPYVLLALPASSFASIDFHPAVTPQSLTGTGLNVTQLTFTYDYFAPLTIK